MDRIELAKKYYKTSGLDIPEPIRGLITEIEQLKELEDNLDKAIEEKIEIIRRQIEEIEQLRKKRDFWKATVYVELEENYPDSEVDNEMYEYERELQQALKER